MVVGQSCLCCQRTSKKIQEVKNYLHQINAGIRQFHSSLESLQDLLNVCSEESMPCTDLSSTDVGPEGQSLKLRVSSKGGATSTQPAAVMAEFCASIATAHAEDKEIVCGTLLSGHDSNWDSDETCYDSDVCDDTLLRKELPVPLNPHASISTVDNVVNADSANLVPPLNIAPSSLDIDLRLATVVTSTQANAKGIHIANKTPQVDRFETAPMGHFTQSLSPILGSVHERDKEAGLCDFQCTQELKWDADETRYDPDDSVLRKELAVPLNPHASISTVDNVVNADSANLVPPLNIAPSSLDIDLRLATAVTSTQANAKGIHIANKTPQVDRFETAPMGHFTQSLSPILGSVHERDEEAGLCDFQCTQKLKWDADETRYDPDDSVLRKELAAPLKPHAVSTQHHSGSVSHVAPVSLNWFGIAKGPNKVLGVEDVQKPGTSWKGKYIASGGVAGRNMNTERRKSPLKNVSNSSFDRCPKRSVSPTPYRYQNSPVRKKNERMALKGTTCTQCSQAHHVILGIPKTDEKYKEIINKVSRHRSKHGRRCKTPPDFWNPDWVDKI